MLERRRMDADVPLRDETLLALVDELDRILDRDHMVGAGPIDKVYQRAQRRRLSRTRWACHEDKSLGEMTESLHLLGNAHLVDRDDRRRNRTEDGAGPFAVTERVSAEASDAGNLVGKVCVVDFLELDSVLVEHHRAQHCVDLVGG